MDTVEQKVITPRGKRKYDWVALKAEFITSNELSVTDFLKKKGVPNYFQRTAGWARDRKEHREKALAKTEDKVIEITASNIIETRQRQARLARFLQMKGAEKLKTIEPKDLEIEDARKMVISGLQEERKALGIEGGGSGGSPNLTQININSGPKTNLDRLVETMDYEQLLGLIAELKRLRAGRYVPEATEGGTGQAQEGEVV